MSPAVGGPRGTVWLWTKLGTHYILQNVTTPLDEYLSSDDGMFSYEYISEYDEFCLRELVGFILIGCHC